MSRIFSKDYSLKTFENQEQSTDEKHEPNQMPNFFTQTYDKNQNYSEIWSKSHHLQEQNPNKRSGASLNNRMNSSNHTSENKNESRKPLNDLLKSNKDTSVHGSGLKPQSKPPKEKAFYKTIVTEGNEVNFEKLGATIKKSKSKDKNLQKNATNQQLSDFYCRNLGLNRLKQSVKHIKTLQQEVKRQGSQSRSAKKKGLQCTLYEKSLEKKINESDIKSTKKLITIKKKFEKTEADWGADQEVPQKDIKKILLKKKNKEVSLNPNNCFNSLALKRSKQKRMSMERTKGSISRPKISQNIRQVSKNKKEAYAELSRSMNTIIQSCKNQQFTLRPRSSSKSIEKPRLSSIKKNFNTQKKPLLTHQSSIPQQNFQINIPSASKGHKIIINDKIQSSLDKIHEKYKFILNYMTDFDIIGKLNGYQIANIDECKWILLVIDDVYEMIKHSEQTKLKGMEYSREYQFSSAKKEFESGNECEK